MDFPPSLPADIVERSLHARNGELGVAREDTEAFLAACEIDRMDVLGWELWLVDHIPSPEDGMPQRSDGAIIGVIPCWALLDADSSAMVGGSGNLNQIRLQLASLKLADVVKPQWLRHIRFNFTLDI
jgi:hypothetical protein